MLETGACTPHPPSPVPRPPLQSLVPRTRASPKHYFMSCLMTFDLQLRLSSKSAWEVTRPWGSLNLKGVISVKESLSSTMIHCLGVTEPYRVQGFGVVRLLVHQCVSTYQLGGLGGMPPENFWNLDTLSGANNASRQLDNSLLHACMNVYFSCPLCHTAL